ncbi:MAG TPA: hypothetical protein VFA55_03625 [Candidatus Kapabacteria bacterium]|nr:hypothetical protein [Candidatus Kapabacteria bacterium]
MVLSLRNSIKVGLSLCSVAALLVLMSCKDPAPVGSGTGNNFNIYPDLGWSFAFLDPYDLIPNLAGSPQGPVQGLIVTSVTGSGNYIYTDIAADFAVDGGIGALSNVACNGYRLTAMTHAIDSTGGLPLFAGIEYNEPPKWDTTHFIYGNPINWEIDLPDGEAVRDTAILPPNLQPVLIGNDTVEFFDTLSISQGLKIEWANPQPAQRIQISIDWYPLNNNTVWKSGSFRIATEDSGNYFLSTAQLQSAGFPLTDTLNYHITLCRGSYKATKTYHNGNDLLGNLVYAEYDVLFIVKP